MQALASVEEINQIARSEWPKVVATLTQELADLGLAEDVTQEAFTEAVERWPKTGIPQRPIAWLITVARRRAIDKIRRDSTGRNKTELVARLEQRLSPAAAAIDSSLVRDEQLQLMFSCAHPSLSLETQVALTLRCVAGMPTSHAAKALLVTEKTMAQRLVRGKRKIKEAAIPLVMPSDEVLLERLPVVHSVIYLIFTSGHVQPEGDSLYSEELTGEAIRLAELLTDLMPEDAETYGLLALMLVTDARRTARTGPNGELVLLADQDRSKWDKQQIVDAKTSLDRALLFDKSGPYQIQAAIGILHCDATSEQTTEWNQIKLLYKSLLSFVDTPVVRLNYAVAVAMTDGAEVGLSLLKPLAKNLANYHYYHSAVADLQRRNANKPAAAEAYRRALELVTNSPERQFLERRLRSVS